MMYKSLKIPILFLLLISGCKSNQRVVIYKIYHLSSGIRYANALTAVIIFIGIPGVQDAATGHSKRKPYQKRAGGHCYISVVLCNVMDGRLQYFGS